jgi:predicted transcriptional regulator
MLVDTEIRERLSHYCSITKQTQEKAANQALRELLERVENDPLMKQRMDRVASLKAELASL